MARPVTPRPSPPARRARAVFGARPRPRKVEDITTLAQLSKGAFSPTSKVRRRRFESSWDVVLELERMLDETSEQQLATAPGEGSFNLSEGCHVKNVELFEYVWENRI